jgi:hypothetical protein
MCISNYESLHEERKRIIADIAYLHSQCDKHQDYNWMLDPITNSYVKTPASNIFSIEAHRLSYIRDAIESRLFGV